MAHRTDSAGLITSTDDALSLDCYEQALASLFRADGTALATIERAIARDPAFTLGHSLRAGALVLGGSGTSAPALAESIDAINADRGADERDRRHAAAAQCWLRGDVAR